MLVKLIIWWFNWFDNVGKEDTWVFVCAKPGVVAARTQEYVAPYDELEKRREEKRKEKLRREYAMWKDNNALLFG